MTLLANPPERYFISVNTPWPSTRTAMTTHSRFASAVFDAMLDDPDLADAYEGGTLDYLPFIENPNWLGRGSVPRRTVGLRYRLDHDAELVRRQHFPRLRSRFSAVFAFADVASASEPSSAWVGAPKSQGVPSSVRPSQSCRQVELPHLHRSPKSQHMTGHDFIPAGREQLWMPYWAGDPPPIQTLPPELDPPLWEYLIDHPLSKTPDCRPTGRDGYSAGLAQLKAPQGLRTTQARVRGPARPANQPQPPVNDSADRTPAGSGNGKPPA
jgi:hypothetical protein